MSLQNLYYFLLWNINDDILKNVVPLTSIVNGKQNSLVTNIPQHLFYVPQKKQMHGLQVWNNMGVSKWQNVHFLADYPFKTSDRQVLKWQNIAETKLIEKRNKLNRTGPHKVHWTLLKSGLTLNFWKSLRQ